jgi:hypothetical protein
MSWELTAARVLPGWLFRLILRWFDRPRPDVRIIEIKSTGGSAGQVDFSADIANYGTQQCRCEMSARVGEHVAECVPRTIDFIPNSPPQAVRVLVRRPQFGDLIPEFNHETTLYDRTLHVEATAGKHRASGEWHETVYDADTERVRYDIQQRVWREAEARAGPTG